MRNAKWLKNGKLRKAILSAFYNISQRNFGLLLILWCSFKLWWNFCLDKNLVYNANGPIFACSNDAWTVEYFDMHASLNTLPFASFEIRNSRGFCIWVW